MPVNKYETIRITNTKEKRMATKNNLYDFVVQIPSKGTTRITRALKRIPPEAKNEYRQFYFRTDIAQAKIVVLLLAVAIALFAFTDFQFFEPSLGLYLLEAARLGMVTYSILQLIYLNRVKNYRSYDKSIFIYTLFFVIFSLLVNATRLHAFTVHVIIAEISIFVIYLAIPTRYAYQTILSLTYTIGEILLIIPLHSLMDQEVLTALFSLIFSNAVAAATSWQLHSYRWRIYQNYAERKETERLITIGQTASMVGHDIRNPLQSITGDLYLIQDELNKKPNCKSEDITESVQAINENMDYINKIISDLQDYTRTLKPAITTVNLKHAISSILSVNPIPNRIQKIIEVEENLTLKTDPTYIRRIITNLITNAIQAMPKDGKLTIQALKEKDKTVIYVKDTGAGISEEAKPNLFKPLFTTKPKGQGLGLPVVKRLVEALGGTITFESQTEKGTTFTIQLPKQH